MGDERLAHLFVIHGAGAFGTEEYPSDSATQQWYEPWLVALAKRALPDNGLESPTAFHFMVPF